MNRFIVSCLSATFIGGSVVFAQQFPSYEEPPVFAASQLLPVGLLQGPQHRVRDHAPSDGFLIHFTMDTNYGVVHARGLDELAVRVHEMGAIQLLVETSKSDLFAEGLKKSVEAPIDAVKNIAADPEGAMKKAPATVGHFFQKVGSSVSNAATKVGDKWQNRDPDQNTEEMLAETGKGIGKSAKSVAGFDKAKLDCARKLSVNPYSDNELLQSEMEKVTWAFFAGGLPLRLGASAVSGGASMALTATKTVGIPEDIYDVTPGELLLRDRQAMEAMGADQALIEKVFLNPNLNVALRHGAIQSLSALPGGTDRLNVVGQLASCATAEQARYFYQVLEKLKARHHSSPYKALSTVMRMPAGVTQDGVLEVVAPVDYLCWTPQIAQFASTPKMPGQKYRAVVYGKISPSAIEGFKATGWEVVDL
ncbi:hypothetical protein ACFPK9_06515 [Rubritalea spongiae]|uniref:Uncharacterized protein n=1 Tax=Rubritalea spongiae TaxID=430797 RepID=A0ABW5E406_9BACT